MKQLRKRIFAAVLAALMLTTAMPGTALYASAETETVSDNAIGQAGTDDTEETGDGDTEETETDDAEEAGDSDTEEPAQEPPADPPEENTGKQEDTGICKHHQEHDADCGYIPKSEDGEGSPCTYECHICPIEDLIAALPDTVTEDNADDVRAQLDEILVLYRELDEDEQGQIDLSRCYELQEALDNANAPMQAAGEINISQNRQNILTEEDGGCPGHTFTGTAQLAMIYVESGAHNVTFSSLNIFDAAYVGIAPGATMNLTIEGTNTIQAASNLAGIYVPADAALVIQGAGSLDVSGSGSAGIGGAVYAPDEYSSSGDPNCGTVVINGGTITATGGSGCAGIGGGTTDYVPGNGGTVTINDGTVTAKGGSDNYYGGAGIGGAGGVSNEWNKLVSGNGGTLTINGGTVNLTAGTHNPQYPAYGFGQGSGSASSGTCELTLADEDCLTLAEGTTLDPKGKYTINGDPTEDMIVVPEDLIYNGKAQELDGKIYIDDSKTGTGTYFNQTFTVKASADGWTYTINPSEVKAAGDYTVTFSKEGHTSISKTFTVAKSGTDLTEGKVKTFNGETETTSFSADDTITVKAAPTATGTAPQKAAARLRSDYTAPTEGQMALFVGDVQVSEPMEAEADGTYTMTVSAADVRIYGTEGQDGKFTLTVRFMGTGNMAAAEASVKVTVTPNPLTADMVTLDKEKVTYNGTEQKPAFSVKHGETPLTEGTDYEVSYTRGGAATTDLTNAGTITVAVTGKGNYGGTVKKTFTIEKAPLTVTANPQTITYGESIENETERVTVTGLCGSDTLTDITLTPSTENVPGGTIMPSAAKIQNSSSGDASANYDITYKQGTLTINKAQNPPRMPSAVMGNVSKSCQKVSDVPLPDGWVWQDADKEKALEVGVPVSAVAVYVGADKGNYENLTAPVQITRSDCDHTEGEILYTGDGESEPTCTKEGLGHTVCTRCGAVVREYITVPALGHDYDAGEVTKEPTLEDEGERKYTCKRCGHTYTETIPKKEPQGLWIDHMQPSMDYTGAAVRQEQIEVYYGTTLLREKVDYTISYKNNSKAGTAQIIVTGKGNYTGKAVETFEIRPVDIGAQPGMTAIVATAVETGKTLRPAVTVTWNGKKLKEKTDYTLSYNTSIKTAGAYEVTVSGKGNYTGSMVKAFVVKPRGTKLLKSAAVSGIKKSYPYPGSGLAADLQGVVVKMGKTTLIKGTDYTVRTENTDVVGTGTVIIEAAQTDAYAGERRIAVRITGTDLRKGSIKGVERSYPYTGMPITPQITVYSGRSGKGEVIPADKYTVSYTNNTEKGKATVTATGISEKGYSGSIKVTYQIGGLNLAAEKAAGNLKVTMPADISHAKGGAKPQPVITYTYEGVTRTLREGADYTLRYSNHTTATGSKPPTVKITGKGNYSGSITETFVITKQDIGRLSITVTDRAYGKTRKGSYYYSAPKVYDLDGNQLKSGRDYTVQYTYADSGNPIGKNDQIEAGTKLCAVVAAHEKSSYTGTLRATYVVREAKAVKDIGKVKNDKIENQPYTGSAIMPEVRLYTQTGKIKTYLTEEDYEVIGCYNNSRRGTATILVRGKGAYSGVKRVTFKIVQKKIR